MVVILFPECPICGRNQWRGRWRNLTNTDWDEIDRQKRNGKRFQTRYITCNKCKEVEK